MHKIALLLAFVTGCGAAPLAFATLQTLAPTAVDAVTQLVRERWGSDAEVDVPSAGCFEAPDRVADFVGDDDREFVYACCRGKAVPR